MSVLDQPSVWHHITLHGACCPLPYYYTCEVFPGQVWASTCHLNVFPLFQPQLAGNSSRLTFGIFYFLVRFYGRTKYCSQLSLPKSRSISISHRSLETVILLNMSNLYEFCWHCLVTFCPLSDDTSPSNTVSGNTSSSDILSGDILSGDMLVTFCPVTLCLMIFCPVTLCLMTLWPVIFQWYFVQFPFVCHVLSTSDFTNQVNISSVSTPFHHHRLKRLPVCMSFRPLYNQELYNLEVEVHNPNI